MAKELDQGAEGFKEMPDAAGTGKCLIAGCKCKGFEVGASVLICKNCGHRDVDHDLP